MRRRLSLALLLGVAACAADLPLPPLPPAPAAAVAPAEAPRPPELRLPATVAPVRYAATLRLIPADPGFTGVIDIDLTLKQAQSLIWLNGAALTVSEAHLEVGGRSLPARVVPGGDDFLGFAFDEAVPAGPARLHVAYSGSISDKDDRGVFREKDGDELFAFSQFENTDARRAFPCFDEPSFKVPWQLTLEVKEGHVALSNTPATGETPLAGGMKAVRFAETKPLPSYLVAFAIGPFEMVSAGKAGKKGIPLRIAVPRGKAGEAAYAAEVTAGLLGRLEDYFGIPYPYDKLDIVPVPQLVSFGAMENAGLITCFKAGMMARPDEDTLAFKQRYADVMTHEMAHQWFGDLVTMAWWDDVWLNEAFATWMEGKILEPWKPEWKWEASRSREAARAMSGDALVSARKIRQGITTNDDIENAFDDITYLKGAAVIGMFESWVGPEKFRKGIARYLDKHAFGNATSHDFLGAVSADAGRDVGAAFSTFLNQPGVPLVGGELSCDGGRASIALTQERYLPAGSTGSAAQSWQIPVCVRFGKGKASGNLCTLLTEPKATIPLPLAAGCADWALLNAGGTGYYHARYSPRALAKLLDRGGPQLSLTERLGLTRDMGALVASGKLPVGEAFARLPELLKDPSPQMLRGAIDLVQRIREVILPAGQSPKFAHFIDQTFGPRARALGWKPKPGEDPQLRLVRPALLSLVADRGRDRALRAEAGELARKWLGEPAAIEADMIDAILAIAAHDGDRALFNRFHAEVNKTKDDNRRQHLLRAMASFRDAAVAKASLGIILTAELDPRDAILLLRQDERQQDEVFAFVKQNFEALTSRMPTALLGNLASVGEPFCDDAHRSDVDAFFRERAGKLLGGTRTLAQALEKIGLCAGLRGAQETHLTAFLKTH